MVWNVVEPDSTEAVAFGDMRTAANGNSLPGVLLGTAPGRNDDYTPQMWRSNDGVTWTPVNVDPPFGGLGSVQFASDAVYTVGTAPGVAANHSNPLLFGTSHDDGATWDQLELPVDTNAGHDLPFVVKVSSTAMLYPLDNGGVVVWLYSGAQLDWPAIADQLGVQATDTLAAYSSRDGVLVPVDPNCVPSSARSMSTVPVFGVATTTPAQSDVGGCEQQLVGWDEIGVPQSAVDLAYGTAREFRVVGSDVTELAVPPGVVGGYGGSSQEPLFSTQDGTRWYRLGSDGVLVDATPPSGDGYPIGTSGETDFVQAAPDSGIFGGYSNTIGASTAGGPWAYSDWSGVVGDGRLAYVQMLGVTGAGVVEVMQVMPDAIAAQGGVSVSSGGYTASRATARSPLVITDDATGETVDLTRVWYGPDGVEITDADGNKVGAMDGPTFQSVLSDPSGGAGPEDILVAVSADGQHVSVESITQLLGVDVSDISSVPRISTAGNTTVIAVTLKERNADGVPRQLVLVGTPKV